MRLAHLFFTLFIKGRKPTPGIWREGRVGLTDVKNMLMLAWKKTSCQFFISL